MRAPELRIHEDELLVDSFAGGGGASLGIEMALGRSPDIAINHDPEALAMHAENHPGTRHYCENIWQVDPVEACRGQRVGLAWFSPDCTFHSKARGSKPFRDRDAAKRRRGLAWVVTRWARAVRPRIICLENVEEFQAWGPLRDDGTPDPERCGFTFRRWVAQLRNLGYAVEWRELRACDYGAPTSRKRLFLVARCDGEPIVWPEPSHGPRLDLPWRTAAECIDWTIACRSIFERARPLAENTLKRIARGLVRYVTDCPEPYIIGIDHASSGASCVWPGSRPLTTITTENRHAVVAPALIQTGWGEREGQAPRCLDIQQPIGTLMAGGVKHALVAAFIARHYGGHENDGAPAQLPIPTITTRDHHALVTARAGRDGAQHSERVRAFLVQYYGTSEEAQLDMPLHTVTTRDRFGLVQVMGAGLPVEDIGMRMLVPRELFRAQGFPDTYRIEIPLGGKTLGKTAQVRMVGNSVCPPMAAAVVRSQVEARRARVAGRVA